MTQPPPTAASVRASEEILAQIDIITACDSDPAKCLAEIIDASGLAECIEVLKQAVTALTAVPVRPLPQDFMQELNKTLIAPALTSAASLLAKLTQP